MEDQIIKSPIFWFCYHVGLKGVQTGAMLGLGAFGLTQLGHLWREKHVRLTNFNTI